MFVGKSGYVKMEKADDSHFLFEADDGMHPLSHDAVFRPRNEEDEPLIILFDGVTAPLGANTSKEAIQNILATITIAHETGRGISISSRLGRILDKILTTYLGPILVIMLLLYAFLGGR